MYVHTCIHNCEINIYRRTKDSIPRQYRKKVDQALAQFYLRYVFIIKLCTYNTYICMNMRSSALQWLYVHCVERTYMHCTKYTFSGHLVYIHTWILCITIECIPLPLSAMPSINLPVYIY